MHIPLVDFLEQPFQVFVGAVSGSGLIIVRDVISCVAERRFKAGVHPDGVAAKLLNIVKALDNALKIAYTVGIGILKGLRINFIKYSVI